MGVWIKKRNTSDVGLKPKLGIFHLNESGKNSWTLRDLTHGGFRGHLEEKRVV